MVRKKNKQKHPHKNLNLNKHITVYMWECLIWVGLHLWYTTLQRIVQMMFTLIL